jgi:hypothetical protein
MRWLDFRQLKVETGMLLAPGYGTVIPRTVGHGATRLAPACTWRLGTAVLSAAAGGLHP